MVLPHRVKAGPTREAERSERTASSLLRRREQGRLLEEELRAQWDESDTDTATDTATADPDRLFDLADLEQAYGSDSRTDTVVVSAAQAQLPLTGPAAGPLAGRDDPTVEIPAIISLPSIGARVSPPPPPPSAVADQPAAPSGVSPLGARDAVMRFRRTAVGMALSAGTAEGSRADARDCATSLQALAAGGHEEILAAILRADPAAPEATWTVACYQIGDLSPSALRDYAEAAPAVLALSECETASHVAAELIVTNGDGVRWTALVRSGTDVAYQPLAPATATASTAAGLLAVRHRWEDQLLLWASSPAHGLEPPAPVAPPSAAQPSAGGADQGAMGLVLGQVLEAVRHIEKRLPDQTAAAPTAAAIGGWPDPEVGRRVAALEVASAVLPGVKTDLERVTRRTEDLEESLRVAHQRLAASEARAAQLEARIAELRRPGPGERLHARPAPPGLFTVLARWMAARLTWWSDRRSQPAVPAGDQPSRRIELVPADDDWRPA